MTLHFTEPPLEKGVPTDSGTDSAPCPMSAWRRVALIAALSLAFAATVQASWPLRGWLTQVVKIPRSGFVSYDEIVVEMLSKASLIGLWSLPLLVFPHLRDIGSFRLPRTWTPFLLFPVLALNVYFFGRFPVPIPLLAHLTVVFNQMLVGVLEELVFRGYAFRRVPEAHARLVVLTSAACFTLMHLVNAIGGSVASELAKFPFIFACGLSFGIVRIASGSLAWSMLAHGAVNASAKLAMSGGTHYKMIPFVTAIVGIGAVTTLCLHPKFRGRSLTPDAPKNA